MVDATPPPQAMPTASAAQSEAAPATAASSHASSSCETCNDDKINGVADVVEAIKLAWKKQRRHLITAWIQVPIGCCFILFVAWALNLAMDAAPFRFPGPVLGTMVFFALLLFLDWLSVKFPGKQAEVDPEKGGSERPRQRKRFVEPVMALLGPPCDFLLRNMSCLFTPAFVLIPARESIPGKEIGLLAAWFFATQIIAYILPVFFVRAVEWLWGAPERTRRMRQRRQEEERRNSTITMSGLEWEKRKSYGGGGEKLGPIATGLSGLTAVVVAPVSHVNMQREDTHEQDSYRHIAGVELERARQQGEPFLRTQDSFVGYPRSDVSAFQHPAAGGHHHHHHHGHRSASGSRVRSASAPRNASRHRPTSAGNGAQQRPESRGRTGRPESRGKTSRPQPSRPGTAPEVVKPQPVVTRAVTFDTAFSFGRIQPSASEQSTAPDAVAPHSAQSPLRDDKDEIEVATAVNTRRNSPIIAATAPDQAVPPEKANIDEDEDDADEARGDAASSASSSTYGPDAIERLADWISDLITPTIYFLLFIVGIPLWFLCDFALALHLSINILMFWLAINVVPARLRRYAHPILTTAIGTVLVIWAFGEMRGQSLKQTLSYYDRDAKFDVLWRPSPRYTGPVPGAADILSSLLDAGIVALFVPLYRYRKDLRECGARMAVALLPCVALSLFFWPTIAALIGLDQQRALAFAARFLSTPLAIELIQTLRGDESITIVLVCLTGIIAAVCKEPFFKLMRVNMDEEYLTVGVTFGATSGAIGASSLIARPRVMAVASLAFVMYGAMCLVAVAIPQIVDVVRSLANL